MSDETPPPSLRLKPRQRPDAGTPPAAPASAPVPTAPAAAESDGGKLRLKPKLAGDPPVAAATPVEMPVEPPPSPSAGERIRLKPKLNQEPAQAAAESPAQPEPVPAAELPAPPPPAPEEGKIKLKIKVPGAAVEAAAAAPPVEAESPAGVPPPFPVVASGSPSAGGAAPGKPPLRPGAPRPGAPVRRLPPSVLAASARKKRIWKLLLVAVGGIVMAAGIISLAYFKFIEPPPPPKPKPVVVHTEAPVTPPTAEPDATKPVVPVADQVERAPAHPVHPHSKPALAAVTTDLAPGVTITTESVEAETEATPAFRSFVADAKISGVFQGTPPRAFINGRLVRLGEVVDSSLGIRFDSIDPKTKNIVFKDATGATVARRY